MIKLVTGVSCPICGKSDFHLHRKEQVQVMPVPKQRVVRKRRRPKDQLAIEFE